MKIITKKTLIAGIVTTAMGFGMAGTANAGAKAYSRLIIDNFQIININTNSQLTFGELNFPQSNIGNSSSTSANIGSNGPGSVGFAVGPAQGDVDALMACEGGNCGGIIQNDFFQQPIGPAPGYITDHFARSDSDLAGAIIANVPGSSGNSATARTVGEVQLNQTDSGNALGSVSTNTDLNLNLAAATQLQLNFNADAFLEVLLHQGGPGNSVDASHGFSITLNDANGTPVFAWTPDGQIGNIFGGTEISDGGDLTNDLGTTAFSNGPITTGTAGATSSTSGFVNFSALTPLLDANITYNLRINHNSTVNAAAIKDVPEPGSLALIGLGLLGVAFHRRVKAKGKA